MSKLSGLTILVLAFAWISGCTTDLPIKNVHEEPISSTTDNSEDEANPPVAATPDTPAAAPTTETQHAEEIKLSNLELQKYAYELGFDPKKQLTSAQKKQIADRKRLRELERSLDSQKERLQYSKVLPWLNNDQEKIDILSIPSIEGRQVWINKNKIWSRAKDLKNFDEVVESQDIALGMPADYVKKSWGEPTNIETSGNAIYKNERWQYLKQVSTPQGYRQETRLVYFEGGRVVGWETE
jgi:aromatic ring-cleaving dioxygenase